MAINPNSPDIYQVDSGIVQMIPDGYNTDGWILFLGGVPSSHVVLGKPEFLGFEYMQWMAQGIQAFSSQHLDANRLRVTHLGGAGCSMARYLAHVYPRSRNTVVEIDAALAMLVREIIDIPRAPRVKIRVGEARAVTNGFVDHSRDIIIRDVFAGRTTPWPLTTVEFFRECARALAPNGLYVANIGDHADLRGVKAELAGMSEVFPHLGVIADPPMLKGRRYGNVVVFGSQVPLPEGEAAAAIRRTILGGAMPAQYHTGTWTRRFFSGAQPRRDADTPTGPDFDGALPPQMPFD